ncbi:TRAP transporter small permease [Sneathiella marina]|uniref:TRAP transporter small permease protein n=1 Tax=Sneathiella marina TaxID=2950108 RepID=A0ABY4W4W3_9PROT|nr:TRAP transporter small permease [Sneathiella marina]USG60334.1 TRAP transporter small permease [Sneathiella marina]
MQLLGVFDKLTRALGVVSAWLFFVIGLIVTYEVVMRYVFNAPTIWVEEISRMLLLWGIFTASAFVLYNNDLIRINMLLAVLPDPLRRVMDIVAYVFIFGFAAFIAWWGGVIALDVWTTNETTGSMLNIPLWWSEIVIPIGFGLLAVQCVVEIIRKFIDPRPLETKLELH